MKKLRVLILVDEAFVPRDSIVGLSDKQIAPWKTEFDVKVTLEELGHEVKLLGVAGELEAVRKDLDDFKPDIVFNMLEEFRGQGVYVPYLLGYLELRRQRYTGCNPGGMLLNNSKALAKKILAYHGVPIPDFAVLPCGAPYKRPRHLAFPLIVKSTTEHGSVGISRTSIVRDDHKLRKRVEYIHDELETDALIEAYIDGRELYVGIMGNDRLKVLPTWELLITKRPAGTPVIATERVKWDLAYQVKAGVKTKAAKNLDAGMTRRIARVCKQAYRALGQTGYARMDLRLSPQGEVYLLESNPNPQLAYGEDFAESAHAVGVPYDRLIQRIVALGMESNGVWTG